MWRPQKNRSRAASGGAALASPGPGSGSGTPAGSGKERSENLSLRRSVSELSLQGRRRRQQERRQQALSMAPGAADGQTVPTDPSDFDQLTQCLIQAPSNRPYFLLLQGYQDAQVSSASLAQRTLGPTLRWKGDGTTTPRIPWATDCCKVCGPSKVGGWSAWRRVGRWLRKIPGQGGSSSLRSKLGKALSFPREGKSCCRKISIKVH